MLEQCFNSSTGDDVRLKECLGQHWESVETALEMMVFRVFGKCSKSVWAVILVMVVFGSATAKVVLLMS